VIRKTEIYEDEKGRQVSTHTKWDDASDIEYRGHGLVPVTAIRQMVPFQFTIPDVSNVEEAFEKFQSRFGDASSKALENIMGQIRKSSSGIITPGEAKTGKMGSIQTPKIR